MWGLFVKVDVKGRDTEAFEMNWVRTEKVFFFWIRYVFLIFGVIHTSSMYFRFYSKLCELCA